MRKILFVLVLLFLLVGCKSHFSQDILDCAKDVRSERTQDYISGEILLFFYEHLITPEEARILVESYGLEYESNSVGNSNNSYFSFYVEDLSEDYEVFQEEISSQEIVKSISWKGFPKTYDLEELDRNKEYYYLSFDDVVSEEYAKEFIESYDGFGDYIVKYKVFLATVEVFYGNEFEWICFFEQMDVIRSATPNSYIAFE